MRLSLRKSFKFPCYFRWHGLGRPSSATGSELSISTSTWLRCMPLSQVRTGTERYHCAPTKSRLTLRLALVTSVEEVCGQLCELAKKIRLKLTCEIGFMPTAWSFSFRLFGELLEPDSFRAWLACGQSSRMVSTVAGPQLRN